MSNIIDKLLILRLAVAYLGQRTADKWWDSDLLSEAGLESLDYNFSRAPLVAAFTATCMAAKRLHDDRIGRTGVTHLFRLDPDLEILVQRAGTAEAGFALKSHPLDVDRMIAELTALAGEEIDSPEGPVQIGTLEHASTEWGIAELARHYHAAFRMKHRIFPYFAAKRI